LGNHILNDIINVKIQHTVNFYWSFFFLNTNQTWQKASL